MARPTTRGRPLSVGLVAPPALRVPPVGYGGVERVVATLARGLEELGVSVRLAIAGNVPGAFERPVGLDLPAAEASACDLLHVARAIEHLRDVDVLHDHTKVAGTLLARFARTPLLTTVHNDVSPARLAVYRRHPRHPFVFLSRAQAGRYAELPAFGIVPNGLELARTRFRSRKENYLVFLGRFSRVKGPHEAIALARQVGLPLVLAGCVDPADRDFYEQEVAPAIDGSNVRLAGEVSGGAKWDLLSRARALVAPFLWEEPFGLVLIEAMACGTPVLAYDRGAAREIVVPGRTGFLAAGREALARTVPELGALAPEACRRRVVERFSSEAMARGYLQLYERLAGNKALVSRKEAVS